MEKRVIPFGRCIPDLCFPDDDSMNSPLATLGLSTALALLSAAPSLAQCTQDAFEPNDTCGEAPLLPPGSYSNLHAGFLEGEHDLDFYRLEVPPGQILHLEAVTERGLPFFFDLRRDDGCDVVDGLVFVYAADGVANASWASHPEETTTLFVRLQIITVGCDEYSLSYTLEPDPCAPFADDALEPNDTCAQRNTLGLGSYPDQQIHVSDTDYFEIIVPPLESWSVQMVPQNGALLSTRLWLPGNPCTESTIYGVGPGGLDWLNDSDLPERLIFEVRLFPAQDPPEVFCGSYDLLIESQFDPCGAAVGDAFEPNDDCSLARNLTSGTHEGNIFVGNQDWYEIDVPGDGSLEFRLEFSEAEGLPNIHYYSDCLTFLGSGTNLGSGVSEFSWENDTAEEAIVRPRVLLLASVSCTEYQMHVRSTLGFPYCNSGPNSSGGAAQMSASGSNEVGLGDLTLQAAPLPSNQFGLFFFGPQSQPPVAFGNGVRCVGGELLRLPPVSTGSAGRLETTIDWSNPGPAATILSGSNWRFQAWFRDPEAGGDGFDLSDGLRIRFR